MASTTLNRERGRTAIILSGRHRRETWGPPSSRHGIRTGLSASLENRRENRNDLSSPYSEVACRWLGEYRSLSNNRKRGGGEGGDREIRSSSPSKPQSADPMVVPPPPNPTSYSSINLQDEGRGRRPHAEYMGRNGGWKEGREESKLGRQGDKNSARNAGLKEL